MLEENDWKGKIRIIGLSNDVKKQTVIDHVEKNQWGSVEHFYGVSKEFT